MKTDCDKWRETLENCVQSRCLEIDECCDATCIWGILLQCFSEAQQSLSSKSLHTKTLKAMKTIKHINPINTFNYEALKEQFQATLMKSKDEHYEISAETLNTRNGSVFWKAKNLLTRTRETISMGCLLSNGKILESNAEKFEHLRSTSQKYVRRILAEKCHKQTHGKSPS